MCSGKTVRSLLAVATTCVVAIAGAGRAGAASCPQGDAYAPMGKKVFKGKIGKYLQKVYDAITGRWDFRKHPAPKASHLVRPDGPPTPCYRALRYGPKTLARGIPDPDRENRKKYYRVEGYELVDLLGKVAGGAGNLLGRLGKLFTQGFAAFKYLKAFKKWVVKPAAVAGCMAKCSAIAAVKCVLSGICINKTRLQACLASGCRSEVACSAGP